MAVKARDQVTIAVGVDVASVDTYYKLQSSTATPPSKPTAANPSDWTTTEPTYDGTATNTLYACQKTTLTDGTFYWSAVSRSSSYEAAKTAWNLATAANDAVNATRSWYATCKTAAGTAVKVATITPETTAFELRVGVIVNVEFTVTNSAAVKNLKLNVNNTGEKSIKYMYNNGRSDLPGTGYLVAGIVYQFMYDGDYWTVQNMHYNTNTTYNLGQNLYYNTLKAKSAIAAETIIVGDADGYVQAQGGVKFDLSYPILWCTKAIAANGTNYANIFTSIQDRNLKTHYDSFQGTARAMVYLVGTVSGNTFTLDSGMLTSTEPTTEDGKIYIPIGRHGNQYVYSSAPACFFFDCQTTTLFAYLDGKFRQVTPTEIVSTHRIYYRTATANSSLAAPTTWIEEATGNVYNQWTTKVPPLAASTASGQTKYLYLYTCEQRKRLDGTVLCTKVLLDENTTVIDGGNIITGSVTANEVNFADATGNQLKLFDPSDPTNYQVISGSGNELFVGGESVASFGEMVRIGHSSQGHVAISTHESTEDRDPSYSEMSLFGADGATKDIRIYSRDAAIGDDFDDYDLTFPAMGIEFGGGHTAGKTSIYMLDEDFYDDDGGGIDNHLYIANGSEKVTTDSSVHIMSQRAWASNPEKFNRSTAWTNTGTAGDVPSAGMSVQSGDKVTYVRLETTSAASTARIEADRVYVAGNLISTAIGWTNLQLNSAVSATSSSHIPKYCRKCGIVELVGEVNPKSNVAAGNTITIGTLPAGCRPNHRVYEICQGSGYATWLLTVNTDGSVTAGLYRLGGSSVAMATNTWLPFHVTFIAAES